MTNFENREILSKEFIDKKSDFKYPKSVNEKTKQWIPEIDKVIKSKKIEQKEFSKEKLKRMDNREFLTIPLERRLKYITKDNIKSEDISNKTKKSLEFTFTFDWEYNEELYKKTTAGQVLPKEVASVSKNWVIYSRNNLKWEFFAANGKRLIIKEWTKIDIKNYFSKEQINNKEKKYSTETENLIKNNVNYAKYKKIIEEAYSRWIDPEFATLTFWQKYNEDNFAKGTEIQKRISIEEMFTEFDRIKWRLRLKEDKKPNWKYKDVIAVKIFKEFGWHNWRFYAKKYWITEKAIKNVEASIQKNFESLKLGELPKWVKWLLTFIWKTENGKLNYNAIFANEKATQPFDKPLSELTVKQVIERQGVYKYKKWKGISAAIWAYQFMDYTLQDMINRWQISWNEKFTPEFQDKIATIKLKARGLDSYMAWRISKEQFLHRLSLEWASLPDPYNEGKSHYDKDWVNHSLTDLGKSYAVLEKLKTDWYETKVEKNEIWKENIEKLKNSKKSLILKFTHWNVDSKLNSLDISKIKNTNSIFIFRNGKWEKANLSWEELTKISKKIKWINPTIKIFIDQEWRWVTRVKDFDNEKERKTFLLDTIKNSWISEKNKNEIWKILEWLVWNNYIPSLNDLWQKYNLISENLKSDYLKAITYLRLKTLKDKWINTYWLVADLNYWNKVIWWLERSFSKNSDSYEKFWKAMIDNAEKLWMTVYLKHFPGHWAGWVDTHKWVLDYWNKEKDYLNKNISLFEKLLEYWKWKVWLMIGHMYIPNEFKQRFKTSISKANYILTDDLGMWGYKLATWKIRKWKFFTTDLLSGSKVTIVDTKNAKSVL